MPVGFRSNNVDIESQYVRKEWFSQGQAWVWGRNYNRGSLGTSGTATYSSPINLIGGVNWSNLPYTMVCTDSSSAAIKTDGSLWLWGYNNNGQLGTNNTTNYSSIVQTVSAGTNWKRISAGRFFYHSIKTDGTLWGWGQNNYGQLGHGSLTNRSSPVQINGSDSVPWLLTSGGNLHAGGIKTDGTLWMWGHNNYGQLGTGNRTGLSTPVQVGTDRTWKQLKAASTHALAIKTDGTLWSWGYNVFGNLGTNNITNYSSPVQTVSGGTNWRQLATNSSIGYTNLAIKTDGTLWGWGINGGGTVGDGTTIAKSSPVQVISGGTNWKQVSTDGNSSFGIKTDGTLWAWGFNSYGNLGDGTRTNRNSPVQIGSKTWWRSVGTGYLVQTVAMIDSTP